MTKANELERSLLKLLRELNKPHWMQELELDPNEALPRYYIRDTPNKTEEETPKYNLNVPYVTVDEQDKSPLPKSNLPYE